MDRSIKLNNQQYELKLQSNVLDNKYTETQN